MLAISKRNCIVSGIVPLIKVKKDVSEEVKIKLKRQNNILGTLKRFCFNHALAWGWR